MAEPRLDLFRVDLKAIVSKYIGEVEQNIDIVFAAAVASTAVLFFDEADAIFGRRSEVREADDRYANMEIDDRRSRIETSKGLVILATSLALMTVLRLCLIRPRGRPRWRR